MRPEIHAMKRPDEVSGCVGKEAFESFRVARSVARRRKRAGRKCAVYACQFCRSFHLAVRGD